MESDSVTIMAYVSAAVVAALLTLTFCYQFFRHQKTAFFAPAAAVHTFNLGVVAAVIAGRIDSPQWALFIECLHYNFWALSIYLTLKATSDQKRLPTSLRVLFVLGWPLTGLALVAALTGLSTQGWAPWATLSLAVIALVSVEQLFRYAASNDRQIKLLCMNLAALFLFDIYLSTHTLIFQTVDPLLVQARAAVSLAACLFMALGGLLLQQRSERPANITLSRPIAFYTTSLVAVGVLITVLALGGYYVRLYGGNWGTVIYSLVLAGAVLLITSIFISTTIRSRLSVLINKHLFRHKYDYRSEWLRLINYLAQPAESSEANQRAFFAVASVTRAPGGAIWVRKQGYYEPVYQSGLPSFIDLQEEPVDSPFCQTLLQSEWVFFPDSGDNQALSQYNEHLPPWTHNIPNLWLLFPLIVGEELVGFTALIKPEADASLTWEDLDLLKTIGRQLASYLKRHQQAEQLAEGAQFETYNKLVAFIIHDLNNLIAQQALVVRNAEKHKDNPEFIDDAIQTISHSVDRMNGLLKKLRTDGKDLVAQLAIRDAVQKAVDECSGGSSTRLTSDIENCAHTIEADEVRLIMTFTHFIKNALEATPEHGRVHVTLRCTEHHAVITIEDTGTGMDWDFIHNRLFKPFETTKSGKGMGIGVYLSREYINDLQGTLNVTSALGEGTTVTVELPVDSIEFKASL
ncbi:XrtA/PEP-CTERM system histidine kinase PrsK [Marinimicrobium sp. ABcell2]|uniref:XrtA/PEP-CTERM system histidine kinase PrsK n=1 Tax=Marinimicrobium sp. ABcell2 TaxID=3069751 RepID=UPI0027AF47EF|nr:XrtA/PEP-CTERM system histidine kinase PrsK [Marinimicrobium sp. ABcell2]MDQ2076158.1 PEP-CTERM system histidine kinase PrsK [Marinimicrobium sp. ABcell2]